MNDRRTDTRRARGRAGAASAARARAWVLAAVVMVCALASADRSAGADGGRDGRGAGDGGAGRAPAGARGKAARPGEAKREVKDARELREALAGSDDEVAAAAAVELKRLAERGGRVGQVAREAMGKNRYRAWAGYRIESAGLVARGRWHGVVRELIQAQCVEALNGDVVSAMAVTVLLADPLLSDEAFEGLWRVRAPLAAQLAMVISFRTDGTMFPPLARQRAAWRLAAMETDAALAALAEVPPCDDSVVVGAARAAFVMAGRTRAEFWQKDGRAKGPAPALNLDLPATRARMAAEEFADTRTRRQAGMDLIALGTDAMPALLKLTQSKDADVRAAAYTLLPWAAPGDERMAEALIAALADPSDDIRIAAAAACVRGAMGGPAAPRLREALKAKANDRDFRVKLEVEWSLKALGEPY